MEVWQWVLGAVGVIGASAIGFWGARYTARSAVSATTLQRDADWNARYRAGAERHMRWDLMMVGRLRRVEGKLGIDEPIEDPPPLFPEAP